MEVIILSGGMGTRLHSVVSDLPKPMAPVNDIPFLVYLMKWLSRQNITHAILATGYKHSTIESYFGNSYKNISLSYSVEDHPLGTGGAILKAISLAKEKEIFIINGDTFFDVSLNKLASFHKKGNFDITLALKPMCDFNRYGTVDLAEGEIVRFREKHFCKSGLINGGVYLMKKNLLRSYQEGTKFSFENDFLEKRVEDLKFGGYVSDTYFIDIGIPEDYEKAQKDLKRWG